jgi:hypothetical protein
MADMDASRIRRRRIVADTRARRGPMRRPGLLHHLRTETPDHPLEDLLLPIEAAPPIVEADPLIAEVHPRTTADHLIVAVHPRTEAGRLVAFHHRTEAGRPIVGVQHPLTAVEDHLHFMVAVEHPHTTAVAAERLPIAEVVAAEHLPITEVVVAGQVAAAAAAEGTTHPAATAAIAKPYVH